MIGFRRDLKQRYETYEIYPMWGSYNEFPDRTRYNNQNEFMRPVKVVEYPFYLYNINQLTPTILGAEKYHFILLFNARMCILDNATLEVEERDISSFKSYRKRKLSKAIFKQIQLNIYSKF